MERCTKCKNLKEKEEFNYKNKTKGTRSKTCKACSREAIQKHYKNNREYYLKKTAKRNSNLRKEQQKLLFEFLVKNPCVDCGESDPVVLEFDHVKDKTENASERLKLRLSTNRLLEEIKKCEVRCANCHRRKTAREQQSYRYKMHP